MALPKAAELDLPIRSIPISGPAVDALESRKEDNNHDRFTEERMLANFDRVGGAVIGSIKQISAAQ